MCLVAVYSIEKSETCIGIENKMIVESQLMGGINLDECSLDYMMVNDDEGLIWW